MNQYKNPTWWTSENDSTWERTKAAIKRDWDQTKHDMGGNQPDTNQNVKDTVKQAAGKEAIPPRGKQTFEQVENAYRFGHGARAHFGKNFPKWDSRLEGELRRDWTATHPKNKWDDEAENIHKGWDFQE